MLIRFLVKNLFSFKEESEFNLFPNKTQRLSHHRVSLANNINVLRLSAVYGANGAGKSNLINAIALLESIIETGKLPSNSDALKFKLSKSTLSSPISFAIEFYANSKIYYYTLTFDKGVVLNEYLGESLKDKDILIFDRNLDSEGQKITFFKDYESNAKNKLFIDVLAEKLLPKDEILLSFLNSKYPEEFSDVKSVFDWFENTLVIIKPDAQPRGIAHIFDKNQSLQLFANQLIASLNTGIAKINITKKRFEEFLGDEEMEAVGDLAEELKKRPNSLSVFMNQETGEQATIVLENEEVVIKRLVTSHLNEEGDLVELPIGIQSDGTKRLIEYIPALEGIIKHNNVYLIDEIERSIHPLMIKEIISKISLDPLAKGQLIFTTHESALLDQDILRPDEIWFAQKDVDGSSKLYSLSDFKIHNTLDIENGYLNGRYGGIPFLSNLHELNWHKYEVLEQE